jgi:hypothetical protein
MEQVYPSVTFDDLTPEAFRALSIPHEHLNWVRLSFPNVAAFTYQGDGTTIDMVVLTQLRHIDSHARKWRLGPLAPIRERAERFEDGWRHSLQQNQFLTREEFNEYCLHNAPQTRITAHYRSVPEEFWLAEGAYIQPLTNQ